MAKETDASRDDESKNGTSARNPKLDPGETNVTRLFTQGLAAGVVGVVIFAASVSVSPLPPASQVAESVAPKPASTASPTTSTTTSSTTTTSAQPPVESSAPMAVPTPVDGALPLSTLPSPSEENVPDRSADKCGTPCRLAPADRAEPAFLRILGLGILTGGAAGLLGSLLGFLFGLPRTPPPTPSGRGRSENRGDPAEDPDAKAGQVVAESQSNPLTNSNLIEISDWLAKIIVGAGLVGIKDLTPWVGTVGTAVGTGAGLGYGYLAAAFGVTVIMYFLTLGFLFAYLNTRTVISRLIANSDREVMEALRGEVAQQARETKRVEQSLSAVKEDLQQAQVSALSADSKSEEAKILVHLYNNPAEAAKLAKDFLTRSGNELNAQVWFYLACASGQLYASATDPVEKQGLANQAYEALKRALELNPELRALARGVVDPTDPNHHPGEDDLVKVAEDDPRFKALVADPPTSQSSQTSPTMPPSTGNAP